MMAFIAGLLPLIGLEGEPRGFGAIAFVIWWVLMLMGTTYVLLVAIYGAKQALHVIMAATWAFMILYSAIWLFGAPGTVPGTGPRGREPSWVPFTPTSEQSQDFGAVKTFPNRWDQPGKKYAGGIESGGEVGSVKSVWQASLAQRAASQGTAATKPADWNFRTTEKPATPDEEALPFGRVFFTTSSRHLVAGVTIPQTAKHPEVTVFAFRDKGQIFYWSAIILGVSIILFAAHLFALAQMEKKQALLQSAGA